MVEDALAIDSFAGNPEWLQNDTACQFDVPVVQQTRSRQDTRTPPKLRTLLRYIFPEWESDTWQRLHYDLTLVLLSF